VVVVVAVAVVKLFPFGKINFEIFKSYLKMSSIQF
jgi:hypothetical protein